MWLDKNIPEMRNDSHDQKHISWVDKSVYTQLAYKGYALHPQNLVKKRGK